MRVIITGKNGQVASELADIFKGTKFKTFFFDKNELNICNFKVIKKKINQIKPHIFINLAAYTDVQKAEKQSKICYETNMKAVQNIAEICKLNSILLIHISTDYVFDGIKKRKYIEKDRENPINIYGLSKFYGEQAIMNLAKKFIILRTSWIFSSFGNNFVKKIVTQIKKNKKLRVVGSQVGGPTYARYLSEIIFLFCKKYSKEKHLAYGIYHYSNLPYVSWFDLSKSIVKIIKKENYIKIDNDFIIEKIKEFKNVNLKRPINSKLSNNKINKYLKINSKKWILGLDQCLNELHKNKFYES